jgi:hypothetical protein
MESTITKLLKDFGAKIGLGETLDLGDGGNISLNLENDLEIDFEEDPNEPDLRKKLWIYITLSEEDLTKEQLVSLLKAMHEYHRSIEAHLMIPKEGFKVVLTSFFPNAFIEQLESQEHFVDQLDEHLKDLISLGTFLRSLVNNTSQEKISDISPSPLESINQMV